MFVYNFRFRRFRGDSLISGHLSKHWACYSLYRAASRAPDSAFTKTAWARLWHCAVEKPEALGASNASFFTDRNVHKHFCNLECWFLADQRIEHILDFLIICFLTEFMEHFCEFLSMIYFFTTMFFFYCDITILQQQADFHGLENENFIYGIDGLVGTGFFLCCLSRIQLHPHARLHIPGKSNKFLDAT